MLDHGVDETIADLGEIMGLPVVAAAEGLAGIQHALMLR